MLTLLLLRRTPIFPVSPQLFWRIAFIPNKGDKWEPDFSSFNCSPTAENACFHQVSSGPGTDSDKWLFVVASKPFSISESNICGRILHPHALPYTQENALHFWSKFVLLLRCCNVTAKTLERGSPEVHNLSTCQTPWLTAAENSLRYENRTIIFWGKLSQGIRATAAFSSVSRPSLQLRILLMT